MLLSIYFALPCLNYSSGLHVIYYNPALLPLTFPYFPCLAIISNFPLSFTYVIIRYLTLYLFYLALLYYTADECGCLVVVAARESSFWHSTWTDWARTGNTAAYRSRQQQTDATWKTHGYTQRGMTSVQTTGNPVQLDLVTSIVPVFSAHVIHWWHRKIKP